MACILARSKKELALYVHKNAARNNILICDNILVRMWSFIFYNKPNVITCLFRFVPNFLLNPILKPTLACNMTENNEEYENEN